MTKEELEIKKKLFPVECWSRVVGYLRPVSQWNPGKESEFSQRKEYNKQLNGK